MKFMIKGAVVPPPLAEGLKHQDGVIGDTDPMTAHKIETLKTPYCHPQPQTTDPNCKPKILHPVNAVATFYPSRAPTLRDAQNFLDGAMKLVHPSGGKGSNRTALPRPWRRARKMSITRALLQIREPFGNHYGRYRRVSSHVVSM